MPWLRRTIVLALSWTAHAHADGPLRLEDAVRLAQANNERARKAPLRLEAAEGQVDRARDAFFPTVTAAGTATARTTTDRNGRIGDSSGTVTLTQPLLAPSAFPLFAQARHQRESERWGAAQDVRQLQFDTAKAFILTLSTERLAEAATRRLERARANLDNADARAQAQLASVNDATKARLDLASAARDAAQAEGTAARAYVQLGYLVGRKVAGPLAPPERTTRAAESFESAAADRVKNALARRPDLKSAHERTEALRLAAEEPYYRLIPSVGASAQLRANPAPLPTDRGLDDAFTLNLTWSIFDSGLRYADRRNRVALAESQELDEKALKRSVETDIDSALVSLKAARDSYRIAEQAVAAAKQNSEETEILYRQGLARAIELIDANGKRFDAEVSLETAKLAMEQAYLELRFALGFGPLDEENAP